MRGGATYADAITFGAEKVDKKITRRVLKGAREEDFAL